MSAEERTEALNQSPMMRSFGPDDLDPLDELATQANPKGEFEFVLGPKQLAIALFLLVTLMGLVAGVAYTAGKSSAALIHRAPEQTPVVAAPPAPSPALPLPLPLPSIPPAVESRTSETEPPSGLYLQVGSVDLDSARKSVSDLSRKGFLARLAPGVTDRMFRVLVGPVPDDQVTAVADALREAGIPCFPKRF